MTAAGSHGVNPGWVLVVDDDATSRMVLFRLLERLGHHATVADSGGRALELLRAEPFDLVLLDLLLSDPDGLAVLEAIRNDRALRDTPVLVISAVDDLEPVVRAIRSGAVDYLDKPVDPVLLQARLAAVLENRRLRRERREYLDVVGHVAEAARAIGGDGYDPAVLEPLSRRPDPLGLLARAVQRAAGDAAGGTPEPSQTVLTTQSPADRPGGMQ